jgi:hypothetical protein
MAMGWSTEAKAILTSRHVEGRLRCYVDVEYSGSYGVSIVELTDRVVDWGEIERASTAIEKNFNTCQNTIRLRNDDAYLTPNFMSGGRDRIENVWSERPSGEAAYRDCRFYIDLEIKLASGSWEAVRLMSGMISDLNLMDEKGPVCELSITDEFLKAFDEVLTLEDGEYAAYP